MPTIDYEQIKWECHTTRYLHLMGWEFRENFSQWFKGWCPLHSSSRTRSNSFHVHKRTQGWHCHKCKVGGSVLDLAMKLKHLTLVEAARDVCQTFGISVPYMARSKRRQRVANGEEAP